MSLHQLANIPSAISNTQLPYTAPIHWVLNSLAAVAASFGKSAILGGRMSPTEVSMIGTAVPFSSARTNILPICLTLSKAGRNLTYPVVTLSTPRGAKPESQVIELLVQTNLFAPVYICVEIPA